MRYFGDVRELGMLSGATAAMRLVGAMVLGALLLGCEEDLVAVVGTDRAYSLYGVLSPQLDSQWVRVFPIEGRLVPESRERLDAVFTSTDLTSGREYRWRDSVIMDAFGQMAHVFWAPFAAEHGHEYHITVRRSDEAESSVRVTVPPATEVIVQDPQISAISVRIPVLIAGDAPRLLKVEVEYAVGFLPAGQSSVSSDRVRIPYEEDPERVEDGLLLRLNLDNHFHSVIDTLQQRIDGPVDRGFGIVLNSATLHAIVANEEWNPPGGEFDPDLLVQPEVLNNVVNGFGFVGAGYRHAHTWIPDQAAALAAGFRTGVD